MPCVQQGKRKYRCCVPATLVQINCDDDNSYGTTVGRFLFKDPPPPLFFNHPYYSSSTPSSLSSIFVVDVQYYLLKAIMRLQFSEIHEPRWQRCVLSKSVGPDFDKTVPF